MRGREGKGQNTLQKNKETKYIAEKQRDPSGKLYNSSIMENVIPVRIASRRCKKSRQRPLYFYRNLSRVNVTRQGPSKPKQIPQCLVLNARSIVKPDAYPALYAELKSNNIDVCCISET